MSTDDDVLKALVSDTRRNIVKTLSEGDRTPSDLSRLLSKSKSTISEHLEKLINAGLVEKIERPGRKWVFYTLTRKGESYVSKKSQRLIIILSSVFLSIIGGVFSLVKYLLQPSYMANIGEKVLEDSGRAATGEMIPNISPWFLYLSIGLFALALVGIFALIVMKKKGLVEV